MSIDIARVARQSQYIKEPIGSARHLPRELYNSEEIYALEIERIFRHEWLMVAREEEIAKVGDYKVMEMFGESILLCRDKEQKVRAFLNSCRHRGVEVAFGSGNRKVFSCPYHGWVYGLDGNLIDAPLMENTKGFDSSKCSLPHVQLQTWAGFIFINLDPKASSLLTQHGEHLAPLEHVHMENLRIVDTYEVDSACNWKLQMENLVDIYHVGTLHAHTLGQEFDTKSTHLGLLKGGAVSQNARMPTLTPDGNSLFGNIPSLKDVDRFYAISLLLPPTTAIFVRCDLVMAFIDIPTSASTSHMIIHTLMPEAVKKAVDSDPKAKEKLQVYNDFNKSVNDEDVPMLKSIQKNFGMDSYVPGYLNPLEDGIQHYLAAHVSRLFGSEGTAR